MLKNILLSSIIFFGATSVWAMGGDYKGNGGNVMYCENAVSPYEVVDLYEARVIQGLELKFEDGNYQQIIEALLTRLQRLNPTRADLYREYLRTFPMEARMIPDANLTIVKDQNDWGNVKKGCLMLQAIVQFRTPNIAGFRYFVDADLWNKLDERNKAALALHEFIYREGILPENDFKNSIGVRYFNGVIHSQNMATLPLQTYIEVLQKVGFHAAEAHGFPILLNTGADSDARQDLRVQFTDQNHVWRATLPAEINLPIRPRGVKYVNCIVPTGHENEHYVTFYPDGALKRINLNCEEPVTINLNSRFPDVQTEIRANNLEYNEDGSLSRINSTYMGKDIPYALTYTGPEFNFMRDVTAQTGGASLGFDKNGEVDFVCMAGDYENFPRSWFLVNGQKRTLDTMSYAPLVLFDDQRVARQSKHICD